LLWFLFLSLAQRAIIKYKAHFIVAELPILRSLPLRLSE